MDERSRGDLRRPRKISGSVPKMLLQLDEDTHEGEKDRAKVKTARGSHLLNIRWTLDILAPKEGWATH